MEYGRQKPSGYRSRLADAQIEHYLHLFGAVEVSGTMWCGKTWASLAHSESAIYADREGNLPVIQADPQFALLGETPRTIDEWQRVPALWDVVRHAVDAGGSERGRWILTGSSAPDKGAVKHSGSGRIGRVRMHPMTLFEQGASSGKVSLKTLFEGHFAPCPAKGGIANLAELIVRGGWPALTEDDPTDAQEIIGGYLDNAFDVSVARLGGNRDIARRVACSVARNLGQSAKLATIARDVYGKDKDEQTTDYEERTVSSHLEILSRIYLIDEVPGWVPATRSPLRMRVKPKRYFADPSIAASLLGLSETALLSDGQTLGLLFENLCMRDLDVYARAAGAKTDHPVRYYHDDSGLEADAVIEMRDGSWAAFEIKLSADKADAAAKALLRLARKVTGSKAAQVAPPAFLAVLTATGEAAYCRDDGVYVIPITTLGA